MAQIRIHNLRKDFGAFTAVKGSSFTIEDGEFFMLLAPSGCGKTTTLRMMAGLELPTSGEIFIDGEEVAQKRASQRDIAFVFQMFALYPHMTVGGNIGYPLKSPLLNLPAAQIAAKVQAVAETLRIAHKLHPQFGTPREVYENPVSAYAASRLGQPRINLLTFRAHDLVTVTEAHTDLRPGDLLRIRPRAPFYFDASGARLI